MTCSQLVAAPFGFGGIDPLMTAPTFFNDSETLPTSTRFSWDISRFDMVSTGWKMVTSNSPANMAAVGEVKIHLHRKLSFFVALLP